MSHHRLFFLYHQNTDGSLPANETGGRISTALFYVSTVTPFVCQKNDDDRKLREIVPPILALNFPEELSDKIEQIDQVIDHVANTSIQRHL